MSFYGKSGLENPAVIIDANHANSGKQCLEQVRITKDVVHSCNHNADLRQMVKGMMIESYIEDGAQKIGEHIYGKSITDPCLGWGKDGKADIRRCGNAEITNEGRHSANQACDGSG